MDLWQQLSLEWQRALQSVHFKISEISEQLSLEVAAGREICPSPEHIFKALGPSPKKIKVIIVGQDPYPNPNHATGLAFAVPNNSPSIPPTLKNILKEAQSDLSMNELPQYSLESWQRQGVLLLNTVLTTRSGQSLAHANLDWQVVTSEIIRAVLHENPQVIAVLWGNLAQEYSSAFDQNCIISSVHPSPLSAYRGFIGSRPFSQVNERLLALNEQPINWAE